MNQKYIIHYIALFLTVALFHPLFPTNIARAIDSNDEQTLIELTNIDEFFKNLGDLAHFFEPFTKDSFENRWITSTATKAAKDNVDESTLRYSGIWELETDNATSSVFENDFSLVLKTPAAHHAISTIFETPLESNGVDPLVLQYEIKLKGGLECGGAYLKLLTASETFQQRNFEEATPYTIMFGPDRCGLSNKVHFILRHFNPISREYEEKHFKNAPKSSLSNHWVLYTLVLYPSNDFEILIDGKLEAEGNLLSDMEPPINPPKEIPDPDDIKPADWVDEATIPDPDDVKPDDWDEEAPMRIPDDSAVKPSNWLDDEPQYIPDPEAVKPDYWDEEEDGEFQPALIANPKCASGCGEWKRPMITNPAFKGKWEAKQIPNPLYKGQWKPRMIPNPLAFEDKTPSNYSAIGGLGFELWTMQGDIYFDNIYVGDSLKQASQLAKATWAVKHEHELKEAQSAHQAQQLARFGLLGKVPHIQEIIRFADILTDRVVHFGADFLEWTQLAIAEGPLSALRADKVTPMLAALFLLVSMSLLTLALRFISTPRERYKVVSDSDDAASELVQPKDSQEHEEKEE